MSCNLLPTCMHFTALASCHSYKIQAIPYVAMYLCIYLSIYIHSYIRTEKTAL